MERCSSVGALRSPPMYKPFFGASFPALLITLVTKIRSPHTTGDDQPEPGMSVFHATFCVVDQWSGSAGSSATPVDPGPRNCGQLSPARTGASAITVKIANFIISPLLPIGDLR